ncbi:MAG: class I SAM-dependent methyltransferase [Phycisphaerales bacterium]|nr:class I SAM-dependent methyltransferase [Phycisphaerales bacterium]
MSVEPPSLYRDAELYDAVMRDDLGDVAFIRDLVLRSPGPALELACGTGRLIIPCALAGRDAVGVDTAPPLLARAREKAALAGVAVRFVEADIRRFELATRFGAIVLAGDALGHIHSAEDLSACLECAQVHLAPGGSFILDAPIPEPHLLEADPETRHLWGRFPSRGVRPGGVLLFRSQFNAETSLLTLRLEILHDGGARADAGTLSLRMWRVPEILQALSSARWQPVAHYGNYHGAAPSRRSPRCLLVCRSGAEPRPA